MICKRVLSAGSGRADTSLSEAIAHTPDVDLVVSEDAQRQFVGRFARGSVGICSDRYATSDEVAQERKKRLAYTYKRRA